MGVIAFKPKATPDCHLAGKARCGECKHTWVAVAPVGTTALDCPKCESAKGLFINPAYPPEDEQIWQCQCGCDVFLVVKDKGYMCWRCGEEQHGF